MKNFLGKIKAYIIAHKIISVIVLVAILGGGYWGYNKLTSTTGDTRYITAKVERGTIISSISGSGQVSASNQLDVKPKVSGEITAVYVKAGQEVNAGATLAQLDARDAQRVAQDAETSLETVKLELEKFEQPPDSVAVLEIKKAIADAENSKLDAEKAIKDKYSALLNTSITASPVNSSDTQTPPTISGTYLKDQEVTISINIYQTGNGAYFSASSIPTGIVSGSGNVTTATPQPIGDSGLYIKFASASSNQSNWIITLPNKSSTTYNANYTAYQDAIANQKKIDDTADLTIAQNNKKLNDLYQPDIFTLRAKQLAVKQAQDKLLDAQITLTDHYVRAPFGGMVAKVNAKKGDLASAGTAVATLITKQKIAEISLNEVDVAKIKVKQKATLTFDAIPDFSMTGVVVEIDSIGTVSQGVVTYIVKISFDTQDERVKPAMSVSAAIITDIKQDVLVVANSAIKSQAGISYVENFDVPLAPPTAGAIGSIAKIMPNKIPVEVGLSNDSQSEIISGIKEGDEIVTRTILPTTTTTATAPSIFGSPAMGNRGASGGGVRIPMGR